jgi:HAD superfamily hydrolase (TIGR01509 family)
MEDIKAVIFDCDGVLVDSEIIASKIVLEMIKPYGFEMDLHEYARIFAGKVERDTLDIITNEYHIELPEDFLSKLRLRIEYALDNDLESIKGTSQGISNIQQTKAVVSNSRLVRVIHSLKTASLEHFFGENLFSAEMVEKPKPDPAVYLLAAEKLGVKSKNCLVIEDSTSGVTAAVSAGMHVIGFLGGSHIYNGHEIQLQKRGAFATAKNMEDLAKLLQNLIK